MKFLGLLLRSLFLGSFVLWAAFVVWGAAVNGGEEEGVDVAWIRFVSVPFGGEDRSRLEALAASERPEGLAFPVGGSKPARMLAARRVIRSPSWFRILAWYYDLEHRVRPGDYLVEAGGGTWELTARLASGSPGDSIVASPGEGLASLSRKAGVDLEKEWDSSEVRGYRRKLGFGALDAPLAVVPGRYVFTEGEERGATFWRSALRRRLEADGRFFLRRPETAKIYPALLAEAARRDASIFGWGGAGGTPSPGSVDRLWSQREWLK